MDINQNGETSKNQPEIVDRYQSNLIMKRMNSKKRTLGYSTNDNAGTGLGGKDNIIRNLMDESTDSLVNQGALNLSSAKLLRNAPSKKSQIHPMSNVDLLQQEKDRLGLVVSTIQ